MTTDQPELHRPDGSPLRILAVDDEQMLTDLLAMALRMEGWEVRTASSGLEALQVANEFEPDALVLDIMMPDLDGMSVLRRLRESGNLVPVLFLTAKDAVGDRIAGLTAGGDDYVTKPFSLEEVIARLRAVIRRTGSATSDEGQSILRVGDLTLNEDSHEVERDGAEIELTATEFELLRYSCAMNAVCFRRPRSSTGSGATTSAESPRSSSSTSRTCARRSMPAALPCCTQCAASVT
jgi:two-component system OmpR family response regulator